MQAGELTLIAFMIFNLVSIHQYFQTRTGKSFIDIPLFWLLFGSANALFSGTLIIADAVNIGGANMMAYGTPGIVYLIVSFMMFIYALAESFGTWIYKNIVVKIIARRTTI